MDLNINVTLADDVMFVDGLGFMVSAARKLEFTTIYHIPCLPFILRADRLNIITWWVSAAFAKYNYCRCHNIGTVSIRKGLITGLSNTQKNNTRSSTES
jgi:hypothetical protein